MSSQRCGALITTNENNGKSDRKSKELKRGPNQRKNPYADQVKDMVNPDLDNSGK